MRMKRSGRTSIVVVITIVLVAAVVGLFLLAGESPTGVGVKFLTSLAKGDTKTLADLSYMEGNTPQQVEEKWKQTKDATKYWMFAFSVKNTTLQDSDSASLVLDWIKNASNPSAYGEEFELPMVKVDGKWKVDVRAISREMYPALPK